MVKAFNNMRVNVDDLKNISNKNSGNNIRNVNEDYYIADKNIEEMNFGKLSCPCKDRFVDGNGYKNDSLSIILEREYVRDSEGNKIEPAFKNNNELISSIDTLNEKYNDFPGFSYYNQNLYQETYKYDSIQESGCCPTCFAMVATYLTGREITPIDVIEDFNPYCYEEGTDVTGTCFPDISSKYGLDTTRIDWRDRDAIINELNEGHPIILAVGQGNFTNSGHFIVLLSINSDNRVVVADPNSISNSICDYDVDFILNQTAPIENAAWSFEIK